MGYNDAAHHEQLRQRFRAVIIGAGYSGEAPDRILAEYFPQYIEDIPAFEKMLAEYEQDGHDPCPRD